MILVHVQHKYMYKFQLLQKMHDMLHHTHHVVHKGGCSV